MHGRDIPMIFSAWDYCSGAIFRRPSQYDVKSLSVYAVEATVHVHKRRSMSFGFKLCGTQLPCFWIIPRARKRLATVERSTSNDSASFSCVWDESWSSNASSSSSSNLFGCPVRSLFLISLSSFLKRLNHSKHCFLDKACSPYFSTSKRWLSAAVFFEK